VHEIFNGLLSRNDWEKAIKMPVGHIPGGSANGLASTIAYLNKESFETLPLDKFSTLMAFTLTKSRPTPMDLTSIELNNGKIITSFLNVEWAIIADVDHESERFRFLGGLRFLVGALNRILSKKITKKIIFLIQNYTREHLL
jgi:diacylglycerol kinase family enzyme